MLDYSGVKVRTAFNVWKRNPEKREPRNMVIEYHDVKQLKDGTLTGVPANLDDYILIGSFGTGSLGRLTRDPNRWCSVAAVKLDADREHFCEWVNSSKHVFNHYRPLTPTVLNNILNHYYCPTASK